MPRLASVVMLAAFAFQAGTPRVAVLFHEHAGGEHAHVHTSDIDALINEFATPPQIRARIAHRAARGLALAVEHHSGLHAHWQQAFHGIDRPSDPPALAVAGLARSLGRAPGAAALRGSTLVPQVRGPPLPACV